MAGRTARRVSPDEVIAFRLEAHHLGERVDRDQLLSVAGACGIQDSPPGSALVALQARVRDLTGHDVQAALADDRLLLRSWCMRGAPFVFPTVDAPVFTAGVLPPTEVALRHFLPGLEHEIDRLGLGIDEIATRCGAEIGVVLAGRRLAIRELGEALAQRLGAGLTPAQRRIWDADGPWASGQIFGEGVVHFCVRLLTLQGVVCFAPRRGNRAPFVLVREWLHQPPAELDPPAARAELLRRYLHCYGPSTPAHFAAWLGLRASDVGPWWDQVQDELTAVGFAGRSWILTTDLEALGRAPRAEGVRLLPPHDPYTQLRDRGTILPAGYHGRLWRAVGEPGAVLVGGRVAGTWRAHRTGRTLSVAVAAFDRLALRERALVHEEAEAVARVKGASACRVELETS